MVIARRSERLRVEDRRVRDVELALGLGLPEDAIRHADAVRTWLDELGIRDPDLSPIPELVLAYLHVGRLADAAQG